MVTHLTMVTNKKIIGKANLFVWSVIYIVDANRHINKCTVKAIDRIEDDEDIRYHYYTKELMSSINMYNGWFTDKRKAQAMLKKKYEITKQKTIDYCMNLIQEKVKELKAYWVVLKVLPTVKK